jgi:hypothetical protein
MIVIPFVIGYCRLVHPSYVSVWTLLIPLTREIISTITLDNHGMSSWDMNAFTKFIYQTLKTLGCPLTNGTLDRKINYRMGPPSTSVLALSWHMDKWLNELWFMVDITNISNLSTMVYRCLW